MLECCRQDTNETMSFLNKFWKYIIEAEKPENKLLIGSTNNNINLKHALHLLLRDLYFNQINQYTCTFITSF